MGSPANFGVVVFGILLLLNLVSVGVILWLVVRTRKLPDCNHIYTLYQTTSSRCALCGEEHPYSIKTPELDQLADPPP